MDIQKKQILENAKFKCIKCNYYSPLGQGLEINKKHNKVLCSVCNSFAPVDTEEFNNYINEKIDWQEIETFRKYSSLLNSGKKIKKGMEDSAQKGNIVSRPAFGYKIEENKLIPSKDSEVVEEIFKDFTYNKKSLNQISKKYFISVNGIKKILKNFTYVGKVKFDSQILPGNHKPIISSELFNETQKRFEELKIKK